MTCGRGLREPASGCLQGMSRSKPGYVYILASKRYGTLYVGVTSNLVRRIAEHKTSAAPGFTTKYGVNLLVYYEVFGDIYDATVREKRLKHWKRLWKIRLIERVNPDWRDLFSEIEALGRGPDAGLDGCPPPSHSAGSAGARRKGRART